MGEEAFYTHAVQDYRENSRFPTLSRYRDLIGFLQHVFQDNVVTDEELRVVSKVERDILLEYELAADIYSKTPAFSPRRIAAERLLNHIYRCYIVMSYAKDRAKIQNITQKKYPNQNIKIRNFETDRILNLKVNKVQADLINALATPMQRIEAELPRIRRDLARLPADERAKYERKINAALDHIENVNMEHLNVIEINRLLGLEQLLKEDDGRVYE